MLCYTLLLSTVNGKHFNYALYNNTGFRGKDKKISNQKSLELCFLTNARASSTSTARTITAASRDSDTWSCFHICGTGKKRRGEQRTHHIHSPRIFFLFRLLPPTQRMKKVAHLDTSQRSPALGYGMGVGSTEKKNDVPEIITSQFQSLDGYSPAEVSVFPQLKR